MECSYILPSLLQLSAEKVASEVNRYKTMYQYLKRIRLPEVYIKYIENNHYECCDFSTYIKRKMEGAPNISVVPTMVKGCVNNKYKITVGSEKTLYISTIFDLGSDMLRLDFPEGEYELSELYDGYVLKTKDYKPNMKDAVRVFNSCDGDKGFAGSYPQPLIERVDHLRLFNKFISKYLPLDWWDLAPQYEGRTILNNFPDEYVTVPVFFYITEKICIDDVSKITLTCPSLINNCGNVDVCWYVVHSEKGRIGIAVQQNECYDMMGDEVGACLFVSNGFRAIGNVDYDPYTNFEDIDTDIYEPGGIYDCEFEECFCDYSLIEHEEEKS